MNRSRGSQNVIERLRQRTAQASRMGFEVRTEVLDGQTPNWCEVGGRRLLFLDLSLPAVEQLHHLNELLGDYEQSDNGEEVPRRAA
ncbi:MAG: hypothetical protein AAGA03_00930 [Planctomycetota bacterium]